MSSNQSSESPSRCPHPPSLPVLSYHGDGHEVLSNSPAPNMSDYDHSTQRGPGGSCLSRGPGGPSSPKMDRDPFIKSAYQGVIPAEQVSGKQPLQNKPQTKPKSQSSHTHVSTKPGSSQMACKVPKASQQTKAAKKAGPSGPARSTPVPRRNLQPKSSASPNQSKPTATATNPKNNPRSRPETIGVLPKESQGSTSQGKATPPNPTAKGASGTSISTAYRTGQAVPPAPPAANWYMNPHYAQYYQQMMAAPMDSQHYVTGSPHQYAWVFQPDGQPISVPIPSHFPQRPPSTTTPGGVPPLTNSPLLSPVHPHANAGQFPPGFMMTYRPPLSSPLPIPATAVSSSTGSVATAGYHVAPASYEHAGHPPPGLGPPGFPMVPGMPPFLNPASAVAAMTSPGAFPGPHYIVRTPTGQPLFQLPVGASTSTVTTTSTTKTTTITTSKTCGAPYSQSPLPPKDSTRPDTVTSTPLTPSTAHRSRNDQTAPPPANITQSAAKAVNVREPIGISISPKDPSALDILAEASAAATPSPVPANSGGSGSHDGHSGVTKDESGNVSFTLSPILRHQPPTIGSESQKALKDMQRLAAGGSDAAELSSNVSAASDSFGQEQEEPTQGDEGNSSSPPTLLVAANTSQATAVTTPPDQKPPPLPPKSYPDPGVTLPHAVNASQHCPSSAASSEGGSYASHEPDFSASGAVDYAGRAFWRYASPSCQPTTSPPARPESSPGAPPGGDSSVDGPPSRPSTPWAVLHDQEVAAAAHTLFMMEVERCRAASRHHRNAGGGRQHPPPILTHLIDGFVIHESAHPFPLSPLPLDDIMAEVWHSPGSGASVPPVNEPPPILEPGTASPRRSGPTTPGNRDRSPSESPHAQCARCSANLNVKRYSKQPRFCSKQCAKHGGGPTASTQKRGSGGPSHPTAATAKAPRLSSPESGGSTGLLVIAQPAPAADEAAPPAKSGNGAAEASSSSTSESKEESTPSAVSDVPPQAPPSDKPVDEWSVEDVVGFVAALGPQFGDAAVAFRTQEIDGGALTLLNPERMVGEPMCLKLGPALKIGKAIDSLIRRRRS